VPQLVHASLFPISFQTDAVELLSDLRTSEYYDNHCRRSGHRRFSIRPETVKGEESRPRGSQSTIHAK
jgi:hypothetical protein